MALILDLESKEIWFELIYNYIKQHKDEEKLFGFQESFLQNMSEENIFDFFELEDEVNNKIYYGDSIKYPGNNKNLTLLYDTILYAYKKYELENDNIKKIIISSDMSDADIFHKVTSLVPFHKLEQEYFVNYIESRGFRRKEAELIFDVSNESWRKSDTQLSLDTIISAICDNIENRNIKFNEVIKMNKYDLLEAVRNNEFEKYSTIFSEIVEETTLDIILDKIKYNNLDTSIIYKVPPEDAGHFINMFANDIDVPKIMLFCMNEDMRYIGIDNRYDKCTAEVFNSIEMLKKWLTLEYTTEQEAYQDEELEAQ